MNEIDGQFIRGYDVEPRPGALGGGWRLRLWEGTTEMGGGVFASHDEAAEEGDAWSATVNPASIDPWECHDCGADYFAGTEQCSVCGGFVGPIPSPPQVSN
jgi:hypothetical protein